MLHGARKETGVFVLLIPCRKTGTIGVQRKHERMVSHMSRMKNGVPFSGPVRIPREAETEAIRKAPAYDREAARAYIPVMPELRELIDKVRDEEGLAAFGKKSPSRETMDRVEKEIRALCAGGHKVSLILADLATCSGAAYCSGIPMCTQSTVKAIYVGALLESRPEVLSESGAYLRDAIVLSSNEAYENLREIYGKEPILRWCHEAGVDPSFADIPYPRNKNARDMLKLWMRLYCFLNGDRDPQNFGAYYADSLASATKERLGRKYPVQTKAGWECGLDEEEDYDPAAVIPDRFQDGDPENDECAINDTGIVYTGSGPYLFVIYTDHPYGIFRNGATPNPLYSLVDALADLQADLARCS